MGIFNFLAYRFVIGGLVLVLYLLIRRNFKHTGPMVRDAATAGALFFVVFSMHTLGLKHTSIAKNAFIVGSAAIFIPFVKMLLYKEKQSLSTWLQVAFATTGLGLITLTGPSGSFNFGDMVTLGGTILFAYYTIFIEERINNHDTISFTAVQLLTVGGLSLLAMMVFESPVLPQTNIHMVNILVMGVFLTGLAYIVSNQAQTIISALSVTIIYTLEPFFAALFAWFLLSEPLTNSTLIGAVLIFTSMVLPTFMERTQKPVSVDPAESLS
tara:strand:- start:191 stop:997 length:807 start_codon:yes stop_codon:yes gene_type:complete